MGTFEQLCTDLIVKARLPLTVPVNYDLVVEHRQEAVRRVLELDPRPFYKIIDESPLPIKPFQRSQSGLSIGRFFPDRSDGICACGCGQTLPKRRTRWATEECNTFALNVYWIIYGRAYNIDFMMRVIAGGDRNCMGCGEVIPQKTEWVEFPKGPTHEFENDHTVPVCLGGGGCWISNYKRLCLVCHKEKTKADNALRRVLIKASLRSGGGPDLFT